MGPAIAGHGRSPARERFAARGGSPAPPGARDVSGRGARRRRAAGPAAPARVGAGSGSAPGGRRRLPRERLWVALLLAAHALLAGWGAVRHSVTFDENFHLPSGILAAARGEMRVSAVNPPLVKAMAGAAALAAGARVPPDSALGSGEQGEVGIAFMRANADRYHRIFVAGRLVVVLLSVLLGLATWAWARRLWGAHGALVSLGFLAFAPEALAHGGLVTLDVATALGFVASLLFWQAFVTRGRWRDWTLVALAVGFTFNARLSAVFLPPLLVALLLARLLARRVRAPRRAWLGLALLAPAALLALQVGYLGRTSFAPLRDWTFVSQAFQRFQRALPGLRLPLPDAYVGGFDRQAVESQAGRTPSFLLGREHREAPLAYFPVALAAKWPLGFLAALALLAAYVARRRPPWRRLAGPLALAALFLGVGMFVGRLGIGIRYVFPVLPALAVCMGAAASGRRGDGAGWRRAVAALAALQALEAGVHAPWHLSFYNALAGGPARGQWIVNDSNVDWGQGLIALREELARRGVTRVHLAYHGTAEPSLYGLDPVPYRGGVPGPESDWLAVSSYYFVGLSQRMMLREGRTPEFLKLDFRPLWPRRPDAMPAGCMLLFRLR